MAKTSTSSLILDLSNSTKSELHSRIKAGYGAQQLWLDMKAIEKKMHLATLVPSSGPIGESINIEVTGLGFISAANELLTLLTSQRSVFNFSRQLQPAHALISSKSAENLSAPEIWLESFVAQHVRDKNGTNSYLETPKIIVHVDVIDGRHFTLTPHSISDTAFSFVMPPNFQQLSISPNQVEIAKGNFDENLLHDHFQGSQVSRLKSELSQNKTHFQRANLTLKNLKPRQEQQLALVSVHFFREFVVKENNPLIFRWYRAPQITHVVPQNMSLAGETIYLFGKDFFASDVIQVRFQSISTDRSKVQDCEFVMAVKPEKESHVSLQKSKRRLQSEDPRQGAVEVPAIMCSSPPWTSDDSVLVALSFNGQHFHKAVKQGNSEDSIILNYVDATSLLGAVVKGVVEREKKSEDELPLKREELKNAGNEAIDNLAIKTRDHDVKERMAILKVIDEASPKQIDNFGKETDSVVADAANKAAADRPIISEVKVDNTAFNKPKHLPGYREKPKDLLTIHLEDTEKNEYVLSKPFDSQQLRFDLRLIMDLTTMIFAAAVGSFVAECVRCPTVLGYLLGGVVVGPQCLAWIQQLVQINSIALLGSAMLLFELGLHFSYNRVVKVRQAAICAGFIGHLCFVIIFLIVALVQRTSLSEAVVFGCLINIASTAICSRDLANRRASDTHEADVAIGVLLVQDILLGIVLAIFPMLKPQKESVGLWNLAGRLLSPLLNVVVFVGSAVILSSIILPWLLRYIHRNRSSEVFFLCCLAKILIMGIAAEHLGMSIELGAFTAGLMIARQPDDVRDDIQSAIVPLRHCFSALFFAAIGLVLDPIFVWDNSYEILSVLAMVFSLKVIVLAVCFVLSSYDPYTSARVAIMLSHLGEFGFVVLGKAAAIGLLGRKVYLLLLATTGISLIVTPLFLKLVNLIPVGVNMHSPPTRNPCFDAAMDCRLLFPLCGHRVRYCGRKLVANPLISSIARGVNYLVRKNGLDGDQFVCDQTGSKYSAVLTDNITNNDVEVPNTTACKEYWSESSVEENVVRNNDATVTSVAGHKNEGSTVDRRIMGKRPPENEYKTESHSHLSLEMTSTS